jgi:hypothetical protein
VAARRAALDSLVGVKDAELPPMLQALLSETVLRGPALRALGGYNDEKTPEAILAVYPQLDAGQKRDALSTLVSRPAFAKPLLGAVEANKVSKTDLTADVMRQLRSLKDDGVKQQLTALFGMFRESSADKKGGDREVSSHLRRGGFAARQRFGGSGGLQQGVRAVPHAV